LRGSGQLPGDAFGEHPRTLAQTTALTMTGMDSGLRRAVEERFARGRPLDAGDLWQATPFEGRWLTAVPTGPSPYAGGYVLVRDDGAVAEISSNRAIHDPDEVRAVVREIGGDADPVRIVSEIERRTKLAISRDC